MSKVAVITGCSSGIGLATTKTFLEAGYKVFGIDISTFDPKNLSSNSENFAFHQANLTDKDAPKTAIKACKDHFGTVDLLANVAGIMDGMGSADVVTEESWERVMRVNLTAPVLLMKEVIPIMKESENGGSIVNVSSRAGTGGAAAGVAYTASKHGLIGASKNVAWRFKDEKIRCNVVAPGGVATNISISMQDFDGPGYEVLKPFLGIHVDVANPWNVRTKVDDVAHAIFFLASDKASAISGVVLPVDGAWSAV